MSHELKLPIRTFEHGERMDALRGICEADGTVIANYVIKEKAEAIVFMVNGGVDRLIVK